MDRLPALEDRRSDANYREFLLELLLRWSLRLFDLAGGEEEADQEMRGAAWLIGAIAPLLDVPALESLIERNLQPLDVS